MEVAGSSEMLTVIYQTTRCHILEDRIYTHRRENLKSYVHSISKGYLKTTETENTKPKQERENIPFTSGIQLAMVNF
jgi:hypothetical protein